MAIISIVPETPVTAGLQQALANTAGLLFLTLTAHWGVTGSDFFQLHAAFGSQYEALFDDLDTIAERIRALNGNVKADMATLNAQAAMPSLSAPFDAQTAVGTLLAAYDKNISDLKALIDSSGRAGDLTTQNMVMAFVESSQKTTWMLRAYLKS